MLWRDLRAWQIYGANTDVGKTVLSTILSKALARRASKNGLLYLKPVSTGSPEDADDVHIKKHVRGILAKCISQFTDPVSPHLAARNFSSTEKVVKGDTEILSMVRDSLTSHSRSGGRYALLETAGGVLSPGPSGTLQADLYRPLRLPVVLVGDSKLGGIGATISAFESLYMRGYDIESVLLFDDLKWGNAEYLRDHFLKKHEVESFALPSPPARLDSIEQDQANLAEYYEQCAGSPTINQLISLLHQKHFTKVSKLTSMPSHAENVVWHPFRQHQLPQNIIAIDSAYGDHFQAYNAETDVALQDAEASLPSGLAPIAPLRPELSLTNPLFDASASWWTQGLGHGNPDLALAAAHAAGRYGHVMFANAIHEPALDLCYNLLSQLQNPRLARTFFTDNGSTGMEVAVKMALRASCQRYGWGKDDQERPVGILGLKGSYHGDTIGVMNASEPSTFNERVDWYQPWGHWFTPPEVKMVNGKWQVEVPNEMLDPAVNLGSQNQAVDSSTVVFSSLAAIFDFTSRRDHAKFYADFIASELSRLTQNEHQRFGALILEPLIMGAGGMIFVDPLFQRSLITTIRENPRLIAPNHNHAANDALMSTAAEGRRDIFNWSGVPVIADEVFTGLYRLGRASSSSFLNDVSISDAATDTSSVNLQDPALNLKSISNPSTPPMSTMQVEIAPDISVHAKLLTGGLLPLAITTASDAIFRTFLSDQKADALLHGHSYTAHAVGCAVANRSLKIMSSLASNTGSIQSATNVENIAGNKFGQENETFHETGTWKVYQDAWQNERSSLSTSTGLSSAAKSTSVGASTTTTQQSRTRVLPTWSFFSPTFLEELSEHPAVKSCFALGTVLALTISSKSSPPTLSSSSPLLSQQLNPQGSTNSHTDASVDTAGETGRSGYSSNAAAALQSRLLSSTSSLSATINSNDDERIHSRVLGDVIYFMTSLTTKPDAVTKLQTAILKGLDAE